MYARRCRIVTIAITKSDNVAIVINKNGRCVRGKKSTCLRNKPKQIRTARGTMHKKLHTRVCTQWSGTKLITEEGIGNVDRGFILSVSWSSSDTSKRFGDMWEVGLEIHGEKFLMVSLMIYVQFARVFRKWGVFWRKCEILLDLLSMGNEKKGSTRKTRKKR